MDRVAAVLQETSALVIEPRFAALAEADVVEKSPGELVTVADREAEAALAARLETILPGVVVVAEEAASADPTLLDALGAEQAWLVDPLDGTANFVTGSDDWSVMVALLAEGTTVASWIWQPVKRRMYVAERGGGAACNGTVVHCGSRPTDAGRLRGAVLPRFLDAATAAAVARNRSRFAEVNGGRRCSGVQYPALIDGEEDFVVFWRTLPWDHAPGALLVEETGGVACRPDGSRYRPTAEGVGLLVAADEATWSVARQLLG